MKIKHYNAPSEMNNTKRIQFIDLAKGVCIILVILHHIGIDTAYPGLASMRMSLYFILSGLFFKDYGGLWNLTLRKTNKILIPFLFFYIVSYAVFYACEYAAPGLIKTDATGIADVFTQRFYFNGPIWFLLCLFIDNILFCCVSLTFKTETVRFIAVMAFGVIGVTLGKLGVFLPCCLDIACTSLPFFYFGYALKKTDMLLPNRFDKYNVLFAIAFYLLALLLWYVGDAAIVFQQNIIYGNVILAYLMSIASVLAVLFVCKTIGYLPVFSYFGRYSIIPLCIHHLVYRPVKLVLGKMGLQNSSDAILLCAVVVVTLLCCYVSIPLCRKCLPHVTAQKDLIKCRK